MLAKFQMPEITNIKSLHEYYGEEGFKKMVQRLGALETSLQYEFKQKLKQNFTPINMERLVAKIAEEGVQEIVVRQGNALEVANKTNTRIEGNIDAPSRFVDKREVDIKTSHCYYSITDGRIVLQVNEQEPYGNFCVIGQLQISEKFRRLNINRAHLSRPKELARKFKLLRAIFPSKEDHMSICKLLNNLEAKVDKTINEADDNRGNLSHVRNQVLESNIPESFRLNVTLIEGEPKQKIEVQISLSYSNGEILCEMENMDASEFIENIFETRVLEEVAKLEQHTTMIAR